MNRLFFFSVSVGIAVIPKGTYGRGFGNFILAVLLNLTCWTNANIANDILLKK